MEAMGLGKPVVSTKKGAEGLDLAGAGIAVCARLEDFIPAIEELAAQPELRREWGERNAAFAREHFDCEKIFREQALPLYQKLIEPALDTPQ